MEKFQDYLPTLDNINWEKIFIKIERLSMVYTICVRSCPMHSSEIRPMKKEHDVKLNRIEASMLICVVLNWKKWK